MSAYFDFVKPTFIENWPQALRDLSVTSFGFPLLPVQVRSLGLSQVELFEWWAERYPGMRADMHALEEVRLSLARAMEQLPSDDAFVRLGSRSPKDSYTFHQTSGASPNASRALKLLLDTSERINDDLLQADVEGYAPWLWAREWIDVDPASEFRCFVFDGKLCGISQYNIHNHSRNDDGYYPAIHQHHETIERVVREWFRRSLAPVLHLSDVVVDVIVKRTVRARLPRWSVIMLEINPSFDLTFPGLFKWDEDLMRQEKFAYVKKVW